MKEAPKEAPNESPVHVGIVEDDRLLRESLKTLINGSPGYRLALATGSVEEALRRRGETAPDVLLLDIHLPGISGSEGVRALQASWPRTVVLMYTVYEEDEHIFESLCNGARGYLLKRTPPARLLEAIREAHDGGSPMSPSIARKVVALFRRTTARPDRGIAGLSPQETKLLALLANGQSYGEAAAALDVTINTVRSHIRSIYDKLNVHTQAEAVAKAMRSGLI
jgi:DNA-binding NarL/FixJ family response regulator